jgi:hypothetical protein
MQSVDMCHWSWVPRRCLLRRNVKTQENLAAGTHSGSEDGPQPRRDGDRGDGFPKEKR